MVDRSQIVAEARDWLGTPYRHQRTVKGVGCDCLGLVRGVYRNVIGPEPEATPTYTPGWGERGRSETLLEAARRNLVPVEEYGIGDVVVFRMVPGAMAKHCGIVVSDTHMIHAYEGAGRVEESALVAYWRRRVVQAFSYPGV